MGARGRAVEVPGRITCPECGGALKACDSEGACLCVNGHSFWDTNSPEWQAIRQRQVPR